jgi:hypothetical protein
VVIRMFLFSFLTVVFASFLLSQVHLVLVKLCAGNPSLRVKLCAGIVPVV